MESFVTQTIKQLDLFLRDTNVFTLVRNENCPQMDNRQAVARRHLASLPCDLDELQLHSRKEGHGVTFTINHRKTQCRDMNADKTIENINTR